MKQKIIILLILTFIILTFMNYELVLSSTINATSIFLYKVFPYLFIMITLQDLLINLNIIKYFKSPTTYIYIMSILSGNPTTTLIISNLYKNKIISKSYVNSILLFTSFPNPLFLYTILYSIFSSSIIVLKLIIIIYLSSFIVFIYQKKNLSFNNSFSLDNKYINISSSIKLSLNTCIMVLGTIIFYLNITSILHINNPFICGLIEMTQGLNLLIEHNYIYKEYLVIILLLFQGLSIHTQVNSILKEYNLDYKYYLKGRVIHTIIALTILFIVNIISYI